MLADPQGSILADYVQHRRAVRGLGLLGGRRHRRGLHPRHRRPVARARRAYTISDEESFNTARALLRQEGILAGSSTGTLLAAALRYCREQTSPKRVVTFVCDTGTRYLTKVYNDGWMVDQGLLHRPQHGRPARPDRAPLRRRRSRHRGPDRHPADRLQPHAQRRPGPAAGASTSGRLVGLIDESDLLLHVTSERDRFQAPVSGTMTAELQDPARRRPACSELREILDRGLTAVIADGDALLWPDHPLRPSQPSAQDPDVSTSDDPTTTSATSPPASSTAARRPTRPPAR